MTRHDQEKNWSSVARERDARYAGTLKPLWSRMLELVGAGPGTTVLDAGCGSGGASVLAKETGANVVGVDLSTEMIAVCRQKEELAGVEFHVADLEKLLFNNHSYDAAIASMAIHFCKQPLQALRELHRTLKPGAKLAVSAPSDPNWDVSIPFRLAAELLPDEAKDILRPFMFAPPHVLEALARQAGFDTTEEFIVEMPIGPAPWDEIWAIQKTWAPVATAVNKVGEERFLEALKPRVAHCIQADGTTTLSGAYRIIVCGRED